MNFVRAISTAAVLIGLGCNAQLSLSSLAKAASQQEALTFGRYELTNGIDNEMCLAIGKQVAQYKRVDLPQTYRQLPVIETPKSEIDYRCDIPITNTESIRPLGWKPIDLFQSGTIHGLYHRLFSNEQMKRFRYFKQEFPEKEKRELVMSAQGTLLEKLIANGVFQMEKGTLELDAGIEVDVYRLNSPAGFFENEPQQCWSIAFDPASALDKMKFFQWPINDLFYFKDEAVFAVPPRGADRSIRIFGLNRFINLTEEDIESVYQIDSSLCVFQLRNDQ